MAETVLLEGEVQKILFQNAENGYTVCTLLALDGNEYTLTGILPSLAAGESLRARVTRQNHAAYGEQWRVAEFEKTLPTDEAAITRYLASHALSGIGKKRAEKIVQRFGADTLSVLEHSPEMLSAIPGISPRLAKSIGDEFRAQFGLRQIMLFFGETFGPKTSLAIYHTLGSGAVERVQKNPYLLCERVRGIGFRRADELAAKIGYEKTSPERLSSGVLFALSESYYRDGQVCLPREKLEKQSAELLGCEGRVIAETVSRLVKERRLVEEEGLIFSPEAHALECEAASRLLTLSEIALFKELPDADRIIRETERAEGISYSPTQRLAIERAARHPFSIVTGGPGTGKTTITRALVRLFTNLGMRVCLAAPTGRAAARLSESSGFEARTLHRTLGMVYRAGEERGRFTHGTDNPLSESVFLIDEVSMVDLELFVSFLRAVKPGSRIVLIGDADQLPSVGAGKVLSDLIESEAFCVTKLDVIYRQGEASSILRFAHEVREGRHHALRENEGDLFFLRRESAADTAFTVSDLLSRRLPKAFGEEVLFSTQVLAPAHRGEAGCKNLNRLLQEALNPKTGEKREYVHNERVFREGDRVIQTRNNYELVARRLDPLGAEEEAEGVFNGDVGVIRSIDFAAEKLCILFEGRAEVDYPFSDLDDLDHAFAVTVHKSQGSEYDTVVLALFGTPPTLRSRALLYTALTRAKKRLILVGSEELSRYMAQNDAGVGRYSLLSRRLQK